MSINAKPRGYLFNEVESSDVSKSAFDLSHRKLLTGAFDFVYPIMSHHCLPGETYELNLSTFFRTSPIVAPVMADIDVKFYFVWCPYRVLWKGWRRFISNGDGTIPMTDVKAGKDISQVPFITNADLHYRGNFSPTSFYSMYGPYIRKLQNTTGYINTSGGITAQQRNNDGMEAGSLADYLGIPFDGIPNELCFNPFAESAITNWTSIRSSTQAGKLRMRTYSSLPFRAYNKIWYDWFRDENLFADPNDINLHFMYHNGSAWTYGVRSNDKCVLWEDPSVSKRDFYNSNNSIYGSWDNQINVGLLKKCWTRDYLTSALPSPQRGADVLLPLGDKAPLVFNADGTFAKATRVVSDQYPTEGVAGNVIMQQSAHMQALNSGSSAFADGDRIDIDVSRNHYVDLSNATSATLNSLRVANAFQKFLEKMARCGSRYVEQMLSMFDVSVPDSASDRTTLISTARIPLQINTTTSQVATQIGGVDIPQGNQTATATGSGRTGFKFSTDEHGLIMGLMCIEPRAVYGDSIERDWFRRSYLDYAWPQFAHLGEQEVWKMEGSQLFPSTWSSSTFSDIDITDYDPTLTRLDVYNMDTFGYQSRYCEYKYKQDTLHGRFKTDMRHWTLAKFNDTPTQEKNAFSLNRSFVLLNVEEYQNIFTEVMSPTSCYADHFYFDMNFDFKGIRPLPLYGTPSL